MTPDITLAESEIELSYVTSQGAGGQNVNKVATAAHLRFDIIASSLPADIKQRLLALSDQRITAEGVIVIKAQDHRTRERNRLAALERLQSMIREVADPPKKRKPTRPSTGARQKRLDEKGKRSRTKQLREKIRD